MASLATGGLMRLMTVRGHGLGLLSLEYGVRVRWIKDRKRHALQLGSTSSQGGIQIPISGHVKRSKRDARSQLRFAELEKLVGGSRENGVRWQLNVLSGADDETATSHTASILVRIDLRLRVSESLGTGGWQSERATGMGDPKTIAVARSTNGQFGRKHVCFDGLLIMDFGQCLRIYPQGRANIQYMLHYNELGLQLIQVADFNKDKIHRFRAVRKEARRLKEQGLQSPAD